MILQVHLRLQSEREPSSSKNNGGTAGTERVTEVESLKKHIEELAIANSALKSAEGKRKAKMTDVQTMLEDVVSLRMLLTTLALYRRSAAARQFQEHISQMLSSWIY